MAALLAQHGLINAVEMAVDNAIIADHGRVAAAKLLGTQAIDAYYDRCGTDRLVPNCNEDDVDEPFPDCIELF